MTNDLGAASCNATEKIEHLDFTPPCDGRALHECSGVPPAEYVVTTKYRCECTDWQRLWCTECLRREIEHSGQTWLCPDCGVRGWFGLASMEPLR